MCTFFIKEEQVEDMDYPRKEEQFETMNPPWTEGEQVDNMDPPEKWGVMMRLTSMMG